MTFLHHCLYTFVFALTVSFSGGDTLKESFEYVALAMFAYMTEISKVDKLTTVTIEAEGEYLILFLMFF